MVLPANPFSRPKKTHRHVTSAMQQIHPPTKPTCRGLVQLPARSLLWSLQTGAACLRAPPASIRLMDKMMHHLNQPRRGSPGNICEKKGRTRPPAPPDLNVGEKKILVSGGATILSIRGNTPVPPTLRSGGRGGGVFFSKQTARLPAPLLQVVHHFVHQQYLYGHASTDISLQT